MPRVPGAAGRIRSGHTGQTRRQLQPPGLANLQHLPPLAGTGFAPGAGGGLGAGPLSASSARALEETEAKTPLGGGRTTRDNELLSTDLPRAGQALKD